MMYILTQREMDDLKAKAAKRDSIHINALLEACMLAAKHTPVKLHWAPKAEPSPWGCILDKDKNARHPNAGYCDECPVRKICPLPPQELQQVRRHVMAYCVMDIEDCEYDDKKSPAENHARAMFAIAKRLHNLAEAVEAIGLNRSTPPSIFGDVDGRGCLERLAAELPNALGSIADAVSRGGED